MVGWDVRETMPEDLVSEALRRALAVRQPPPGLVVHSDQGSQYTATRFCDLLAAHGATQSMSRRGNCYDNVQAESFWSRLKTELLTTPSAATPPSVTMPPTTSKPSFKPRPKCVRLS